jgi:hypothetical protein
MPLILQAHELVREPFVVDAQAVKDRRVESVGVP